MVFKIAYCYTTMSVLFYMRLCTQDMLFGLVAVVQRRVPGVGHTTARDLLRRELVHVLCEGPMSFSRIQKHLPVSMRESAELEHVLREVSACGEDGMFTVTKVGDPPLT